MNADIQPPKAEAELSPGLNSTWPYVEQGQKFGDLNMAIAHLYRAEVSRSNTWRTRLDATTNWAVVTTAAALSLSFSDPNNQPAILIIDTLLIVLFLFIEARRYRYYELFASRVRLLETSYFAGLLTYPFDPPKASAERLVESLRQPAFNISLLEALGRRYRRNYAPIFIILSLSYVLKLIIHPWTMTSAEQFVSRAAIGPVPGLLILGIGLAFNIALIVVGIFTAGMRATTSEVFAMQGAGVPGSRFLQLTTRIRLALNEVFEMDLPTIHLPGVQPRKQLVIIITDAPEKLGRALMENLDRGVTMLHGEGMYTGKEHGVLMSAVNARQLHSLKTIVHTQDPRAFIMVTPLQDVRGAGFRPLEA
jgi:uncharacterized membrane protein